MALQQATLIKYRLENPSPAAHLANPVEEEATCYLRSKALRPWAPKSFASNNAIEFDGSLVQQNVSPRVNAFPWAPSISF